MICAVLTLAAAFKALPALAQPLGPFPTLAGRLTIVVKVLVASCHRSEYLSSSRSDAPSPLSQRPAVLAPRSATGDRWATFVDVILTSIVAALLCRAKVKLGREVWSGVYLINQRGGVQASALRTE